MGYARAVEALLMGDEVDGVLMTGYFGGYSTEPGGLHEIELAAARAIVAAVQSQDKPLVVHTIFPGSPTAVLLRSAGIPVHRDVDRAAAVLAGLVARPLPAYDETGAGQVTAITDASYDVARGLFAAAGIAFPPARTVRSRTELAEAFATTGFPVVLKALGAVHKSDNGGVVLGLPDAAAATAAYDDIVTRLDPPAVSVEAMADLPQAVELIVGCVRDRTFGPVLMVGLGGIHTEVLADSVCSLAPVGIEQARAMLLALRGAPLLLAARGRAPVDLEGLAAAVSAVSRVAAEHAELVELEINPLLAGPSATLALDARVVLGQPSTSRR
jgi:acyl-CoA synthetase (NDP forming)